MILKGEKVVLRPIGLDDAPRFVKWLNDPLVNKFVLVRHITLSEERKYIKGRLKNKATDDLHFCIDTKEGIHIGAIGLRHIHKRDRNGDIGIIIGDKDYWGKGYGKDAMRVLMNHAFIKMYKKLGYKREGISRESSFWNGRFWNSYRMSILDREWKKLNNKNKLQK